MHVSVEEGRRGEGGREEGRKEGIKISFIYWRNLISSKIAISLQMNHRCLLGLNYREKEFCYYTFIFIFFKLSHNNQHIGWQFGSDISCWHTLKFMEYIWFLLKKCSWVDNFYLSFYYSRVSHTQKNWNVLKAFTRKSSSSPELPHPNPKGSKL